METVKDSTGKEYKLFSGTCYHKETPEELIRVLDNCMEHRIKVRVYLGDTKTGKCWNEEHDVRGYIERSNGEYKIPLVVHPKSYGGPRLLDHCIIKLVRADNKSVLYQHPKFQQPIVTIEKTNCNEYPYNVLIDDELYGRCKTERSAKLLRTKMS